MTVEPSSAPRNCTLVYVTSSRPQTGHFSLAAALVWILCFSTACTLDWSFCLRKDGKSDGLVCVTIVLEPVSVAQGQKSCSNILLLMLATNPCFPHHSIRSEAHFALYLWLLARDCRSRCRKREIQSQTCCLCEVIYLAGGCLDGERLNILQSQKWPCHHRPKLKTGPWAGKSAAP